MNRWHDHPEAESTALEHYHDYPGAWKGVSPGGDRGAITTGEELEVRCSILKQPPTPKPPEKVARMVASGKKGLML